MGSFFASSTAFCSWQAEVRKEFQLQSKTGLDSNPDWNLEHDFTNYLTDPQFSNLQNRGCDTYLPNEIVVFNAVKYAKCHSVSGKETVAGSSRYFSANMDWCDRKPTWISCLLCKQGIRITLFKVQAPLWSSWLRSPWPSGWSPLFSVLFTRLSNLTPVTLSSSSPAILPSWTLCSKHFACFSFAHAGSSVSKTLLPLPLSFPFPWVMPYPLGPCLHITSTGRPSPPEMLGSGTHLLLPTLITTLHLPGIANYLFTYLYSRETESPVAMEAVCQL